MSFLVFACGLLLALGGAYAIFFGYGIVAVERGWASLIAGAAALSGGVVTMALGLILHSLTRLRSVLEAERSSIPLPDEVYLERESRAGEEEAGLDAFDAEPAFHRGSLAAPHPLAPGRAAETPLPAEAPGHTREEQRREDHARGLDYGRDLEPEPPLRSARSPAAGPVTMEDIRRLVAEKVRARVALSGEPVAGELSPGGAPQVAETDPLQAEAEAEAEAEAQAQAQPQTQDEAQAEFAGSALGRRPSQHWRPSASDQAPASDPAPAASWPAPTEPVAAEPAPVTDPRAVIRRYESEGAVYVMYADGSIDAQTEHGVLHFESMADLKSFMDEQARGSG